MTTFTILIDEKKLTDTKNESRALLSKKHYQDNLNNYLKSHNAKVRFFQKFRFLRWVVLVVGILTALLSILFFILWISEIRQTSLFLMLCVLFLAVSVVYGLVFVNYDKTNKIKDNTHQLNKFLAALARSNANWHFKTIFKNIQKQPLPFLAIYDFSDESIVYYRRINNDTAKIWQEPMQKFKNSHYLMGNHCCLIFKKPTSQNHQMFLFVNERDKAVLEMRLQDMGLTQLVLSD